VPLDAALREAGDRGEPLVWSNRESPAGRAIFELAQAIASTERERGIGLTKELPVVG
jgi:hypothetical protein